MNDATTTAKLLDIGFSPDADQYLDEMERSGQFRIGADAEVDDADERKYLEYFWGRGSGRVTIQDWWTTGGLALRVGPGISTDDVVLARHNDSLVVRTADGLDRVLIDGYLGLIPDASTLRISFTDGSEWTGSQLLERVTTWVSEIDAPDAPN